jgi:transposase
LWLLFLHQSGLKVKKNMWTILPVSPEIRQKFLISPPSSLWLIQTIYLALAAYILLFLTPDFTMRPISTNIRDNILSLIGQGKSRREIGRAMKVGKSTVHKLRQRRSASVSKPPSGRCSKISEQNKRFCVRAITSGQLDTASDVRKALENQLKVKVSERTVRRILQNAGLGAAGKQNKPKLSSKNIKARLEFAKRHQDWTVEDWKRVIWSDETKINRCGSNGQYWCWIRDGEGLQPRHVNQTVKHGGGSVMIWGCMTAEGPGFMCRIEGIMDQHLYKSILEDELAQTIDWYGFDRTKVIFQQDNDPKHRAKSVQEWLDQQEYGVMDWPPQSPDLNPIEHLWGIIKRRLCQYEHPPCGVLELWERIEAEWRKIDKETCLRLIESMPDRIRAVLKSKGKWTEY